MTGNHLPETPLSAPEEKSQTMIAALITSPSVSAAAAALGVNVKTLWRYLRKPEFQAEYLAARRQMVSQAMARAQAAACAAVATLTDIIRAEVDHPVWAKIMAACKILDTALKAVEIEDLAQRVSAIEEEQRVAIELQQQEGEEWNEHSR